MRNEVGDVAVRAGASEALVDAILLCVSEGVTNAVVHGYDSDGASDAVDVVVERGPDELIVVVTDHGSGVQPTGRRYEKGLGLTLIERLTTRYALTSTATEGTELRMVFAFGRA